MPKGAPKFVEDFLIPHLNQETFGDTMTWESKSKKIFTIRWNYRNGKNWSPEELEVYYEWEILKGRGDRKDFVCPPDAKQRFRANLIRLKNKIQRIPCTDKSRRRYQLNIDERIYKTKSTSKRAVLKAVSCQSHKNGLVHYCQKHRSSKAIGSSVKTLCVSNNLTASTVQATKQINETNSKPAVFQLQHLEHAPIIENNNSLLNNNIQNVDADEHGLNILNHSEFPVLCKENAVFSSIFDQAAVQKSQETENCSKVKTSTSNYLENIAQDNVSFSLFSTESSLVDLADVLDSNSAVINNSLTEYIMHEKDTDTTGVQDMKKNEIMNFDTFQTFNGNSTNFLSQDIYSWMEEGTSMEDLFG